MTVPPRIAYLTGEYPRATDTFIQREVAALRAIGLSVETCSIRRTRSEHLVGDEQRDEATRTFYVLDATRNILRLARAKFRALRKPRRFFRAFMLALRTAPSGLRGHLWQMFYFSEALILADHLQRNGLTHLHNHIAKASCTVAMLTSELTGIPFSFTLHGPDIFFEPIHWRLDEKIARAQFVVCISDFCRSQAMVFSEPVHWRKLHVVHCGVDPERYAAAPRTGQARLLFVGRLAAVKGVPVLLEALQELSTRHPDLHLTLIGDGPERPALEQAAVSRGLASRLTFAGFRSQTEVAEALAACDALILPSFAEGVPVVLMEAMAATRPVVATHIAGIPELVEDHVTGRLVPPGDAAALAAAIDEILNDPTRAAKMGEAGRDTVHRDFNIHAEAARLADLFKSYASNKSHSGKRP